jgi:3-hydroxybutyryl-CoA dehydratase
MDNDIVRLSLSELTIGRSDEISVDVRPEDIDVFCRLSGDLSPLHTDEAFAKKQGFPGRVAKDMLIGAYVSRFIGTRLPGRYGILQSIDMEFRKPLCPPATLKIKGKVVGLSQSVAQAAIRIEVTDEKGSLLAIAKVSSVIKQENA